MDRSLTAGTSRSMLIPETVTLRLLPATSTAVRVTDWFAPFVVSTTSSGQTATPDRASEQLKWMVTGPVYQPEAAADVVAAPVIEGGVLSSRTTTLSVPRLPARSS